MANPFSEQLSKQSKNMKTDPIRDGSILVKAANFLLNNLSIARKEPMNEQNQSLRLLATVGQLSHSYRS